MAIRSFAKYSSIVDPAKIYFQVELANVPVKKAHGKVQELASSDNSPNDRLDQIKRVISEREQSRFQYDDSIVRQMIECIKVYPSGKLDIIFGGGYIVEENITAD